MRITLRLIVSLVVTVAVVAAVSAYFHVRQERSRLKDETERRSRLLAESLQESVLPAIQKGSSESRQKLVERFGNRERISGMAIYDAKGKALAVTEKLAPGLAAVPPLVADALDRRMDVSTFETIGDNRMHVYVMPLLAENVAVGALVMLQDASYIESQLAHIWRFAFFRVLVQVLLITLVTLLVVRWSIIGPIAKMAEWMKQLRAGEASVPTFTAIADNAALTYLGSLVEGMSDEMKYALVAGAVTGGGLTVIATAPNPAGIGILQDAKVFEGEGISPLGLFLGALPPTVVAAGFFWVLH